VGCGGLRAPAISSAMLWNFFTDGSGDLGIGGTGLRNMKQWSGDLGIQGTGYLREIR